MFRRLSCYLFRRCCRFVVQFHSTPSAFTLRHCSLIAVGTYITFGHAVSLCDDQPTYSIDQVGKYLREKLQSPREQMRKRGINPPIITIRKVNFPGRKGYDTETQVLDVHLKPESNFHALILNWLTIFKDPLHSLEEKQQRLHQFYTDQSQMNLPLISQDRGSSMTIAKYIGNEGPRIAVSLFKDEGYTKDDLESIISGYIQAFEPIISGQRKEILEFNNSSEYRDQQDRFTNFLNKYFHESDGNIDEGDPHVHPHISSPSSQSSRRKVEDDILSKLRSYGVEVFEPVTSAATTSSDTASSSSSTPLKMDWSYLAGYDYVKRYVEETIIYALKYPDIYDSIAKNTKVIFESNRPRAVLLEGPPGTGKTLTARILADQCDRVLVVLKLESIVSKWYGDSEKKLSKVSDHR
jgi:hypothetical protein